MHLSRNQLVTGTAILLLAGSIALAKTDLAKAGNGNDNTVVVANTSANPVPVSGAVAISNLPAVQAVSGSVAVSNLPAVQPVSGSVSVAGSVAVSNLPAVQPVSGSVAVSNLPAVQPVSGSVAISNLPAVQEVTGTVQIGGRNLVHADGQINLSLTWEQRYMTIPANAVVTDIRIERYLSGAASCEIWLEETSGGFFSPSTMWHLTVDQPVAEMHLQSGYAAGPTTVERGFFMNSDCYARVFWSGYTN